MDYKEYLIKEDGQIEKLAQMSKESSQIADELYEKHKVYRGLRDRKGVGVVTGLTEISEMNGFATDENGVRYAIDGEMFYRGYNINDIVKGLHSTKGFAFEETVYLLLCGNLPSEKELKDFCKFQQMKFTGLWEKQGIFMKLPLLHQIHRIPQVKQVRICLLGRIMRPTKCLF